MDAKMFIDLGIAGAILFVLYRLVDGLINKVFIYLEGRNKADGKGSDKFDRLCEKIDKLVEAFYQNTNEISKSIQNSHHASEGLKDQLAFIFEMVSNMAIRLQKVDERTRACLGDRKEEKE